MPRILFENLVRIYDNTEFSSVGDEGLLRLTSQEILDDIRTSEENDIWAEDAHIALLDDISAVAVGGTTRIEIRAPRLSLGALTTTFDELLRYPSAFIEEPRDYYIVTEKFAKNRRPTPAVVIAYREILSLISIFSQCATFLDKSKQELVFIKESRHTIKVRYDSEDLAALSMEKISRFKDTFRDDLHKEQKLEILADAIIKISLAQPSENRFAYLIENIDELTQEVSGGYRLFASSFSYSKIKNEIEAARTDYLNKIHKTISDIQGQLLGIPVATIVVASQLKVSKDCGLDFWTNTAVIAGAWVFVALLSIAVINQWHTLSVISNEITHQKEILMRKYSNISTSFDQIFKDLQTRIKIHYWILRSVALVAVLGAIFATIAFNRLTGVQLTACVL